LRCARKNHNWCNVQVFSFLGTESERPAGIIGELVAVGKGNTWFLFWLSELVLP